MTATLTRPLHSTLRSTTLRDRSTPARSTPARSASVRATSARALAARPEQPVAGSARPVHRSATRQIPARPVAAVRAASADFGHYRYSGYSAEPAFDVVLPRGVATIYLRRRMVAALAFTATMLLLWLGAGNVLASRGGDPASALTARPGATHVVQPGDTLWSIAGAHHGALSQTEYVEALIEINGSTVVHVGQVVELP